MTIVPGAPARAADIAAMAQTGIELVSFTSLSSHTRTVTFPVPFASIPVIPAPNIASGAGAAARWGARAFSITTTGFTLFVYTGDDTGIAPQTWTNIPVHWIAIVDV